MEYWSLFIAALCAFSAAYKFEGGFLDAFNIALAVINLGLFFQLR